MISDADLAKWPLEDVPINLAWELADRFRDYSAGRDGYGAFCAMKGVSELAYRCVAHRLIEAETLAKQMEAMAGYLRQHMSK